MARLDIVRLIPRRGTAAIVTTPAFVASLAKANSEYFSRASFAAVQMGTGDFSLEAWVYPTTLTSGAVYVFMSHAGFAAGEVGYSFQCTGVAGDATATLSIILRTADANTSILSAVGGLTKNAWNHIVAVCDRDGNATHYINGSASGTPGSIAARSATLNGAHSLGIGNRVNYTTGAAGTVKYDGRIGPTRAYKGTLLTAPQVTALYNGGTLLKYNGIGATLQAACAGSAWDMDEESSGAGAVTRADDSGVGNDLTDNNTTPSAVYP